MLTDRQVQIYRRLHHETKYLPPQRMHGVAMPAADWQALIRAIDFSLDETDRLAAENRRLRVEMAEHRIVQTLAASDRPAGL